LRLWGIHPVDINNLQKSQPNYRFLLHCRLVFRGDEGAYRSIDQPLICLLLGTERLTSLALCFFTYSVRARAGAVVGNGSKRDNHPQQDRS
jgi:hypothetical protein